MKISYNWLHQYLPQTIEPQQLSEILTSVGLEVESMEVFENFKGGLKGLIVGEVLECEKHPNADKLKLTTVDINSESPLQIVCGAPNVAVGQKVIVAPVGTTIYPLHSEPVTMKVAKIRGVESFGMICAEDEIGLSDNHAGILILNNDIVAGTPVSQVFEACSDWVYEIGLTPNRMDAMSHIGVAKDICAWLSFHNHTVVKAKLPIVEKWEPVKENAGFTVSIDNINDCKRYSGLVITGVEIKPSPSWLQNFLKCIGQRPINNVVDITNYVLHETGQPLHAFNADALTTKKVKVKNLQEGTSFQTLDEVERKLSANDLMICNSDAPVCIAGVFGGIKSGVNDTTKNIFLESAWFNPSSIRKTSLLHGLRTEAAVRFEKGVDISGTMYALKRAAQLINEVANGKYASDIIDIYPSTVEKKTVVLQYAYLKKLSGKVYQPVSVQNILSSLEFDIFESNNEYIKVAVPLSKADISMPADIVEEIIRIDGLNNIEIPSTITITPSVQENSLQSSLKEKIAQMLAGIGFHEIVTNSITNSKYYQEEDLNQAVKLLNNLSTELDIMRPSMLETGMEALAYNINRKNSNLRFFETGKIYQHINDKFHETEKICFWITGKKQQANWKQLHAESDFFTAKGILVSLLENIQIQNIVFSNPENTINGTNITIQKNKINLGKLVQVNKQMLESFGIKQPVVFAELDVENIVKAAAGESIVYKELNPYPVVERDLSLVINKQIQYGEVESGIKKLKTKYLENFNLFDIYEGEKIAGDKKSFAINFRFVNNEKTLTDVEVETEMKMITEKLVNEFSAEIRQ
ncbi:MAG: phenylalanine--tRNA ligase subunit beta [Bacteroidetes bacterium]|nr:phenylalanine--tRNA ligase subunit beta [Bacteroidota bacterium]